MGKQMELGGHRKIWGNGRRSLVAHARREREQHKTKAIIIAGGRSNRLYILFPLTADLELPAGATETCGYELAIPPRDDSPCCRERTQYAW